MCLTTQRQANRSSSFLSPRSEGDFSKTMVQKLSLYPNDSGFFKECIEKHLEVQLGHSMRGEEGGFPVLSPEPGHEALHRHSLLANDLALLEDPFLIYSKEVWGLCCALWGALPALSPQGMFFFNSMKFHLNLFVDDPNSHGVIMMRKEALTEWLKNCSEALVESEVESRTGPEATLSLLTGRVILRACQVAQSRGDHYAALLACNSPSGNHIVSPQLHQWADIGADRFIDENRLKIFTLASAMPVVQSSTHLVNVCHGLDWRRSFALHNW